MCVCPFHWEEICSLSISYSQHSRPGFNLLVWDSDMRLGAMLLIWIAPKRIFLSFPCKEKYSSLTLASLQFSIHVTELGTVTKNHFELFTSEKQCYFHCSTILFKLPSIFSPLHTKHPEQKAFKLFCKERCVQNNIGLDTVQPINSTRFMEVTMIDFPFSHPQCWELEFLEGMGKPEKKNMNSLSFQKFSIHLETWTGVDC